MKRSAEYSRRVLTSPLTRPVKITRSPSPSERANLAEIAPLVRTRNHELPIRTAGSEAGPGGQQQLQALLRMDAAQKKRAPAVLGQAADERRIDRRAGVGRPRKSSGVESVGDHRDRLASARCANLIGLFLG